MFGALSLALALTAGAGAHAQQSPPGRSLPELPESHWPLAGEHEPLRVYIPYAEPAPDAAPAIADWARIETGDGGLLSLLDFLDRDFDDREAGRRSAAFDKAQRVLRLPLPDPRTVRATVETADFGTILGGPYLHLTPAEIYVAFGFLADGRKPVPNGGGIYSPLSPIYCLGPSNSCLTLVLFDAGPRIPKGDAP